MQRKTCQIDRPAAIADNSGITIMPPTLPVPKKRSSRRPSKFRSSKNRIYDRSDPRGHRLMRTRRLIMAALRVWEIKNGIRSQF
jgi:hypothetical protein